MKKEKKILCVDLNNEGVEEVSETIRDWLTAAGVSKKDVLRIRMTAEEQLLNIRDSGESPRKVTVTMRRLLGVCKLKIVYDGDKYDPSAKNDEMEEISTLILSNTGITPTYRYRGGNNELIFRIQTIKGRPEFFLLGCLAAAILIGSLGRFIPDSVKDFSSYYIFNFISDGFLNALNAFIGLLIFLTVVTGICGMGSVASFGKIGKSALMRFLLNSFLLGALSIVVIWGFSSLGQGAGTGESQAHAILEMLFGIIPNNPIRPFLDGNVLQIIFMAILVGAVLLLLEKKVDILRSFIVQLEAVCMRCVSIICLLLPVYIFCSLTVQLWTNEPAVLLKFWKPFVLCIGLSVLYLICYTVITCVKLKVKPGVLLRKLLPDFVIGITTGSSALALSTSMDVNENKLGVAPSLSRMATPLGSLFYNGSYCMLYMLCMVFLAEHYGVNVNIVWWITLWLLSVLLSMATPPVPGGTMACLSIMMTQLSIPIEGLALAATLAMLLDFLCTGARMPMLHMSMVMQADHLGLLDKEVLRKKTQVKSDLGR